VASCLATGQPTRLFKGLHSVFSGDITELSQALGLAAYKIYFRKYGTHNFRCNSGPIVENEDIVERH
jgi:hypothetical protein